MIRKYGTINEEVNRIKSLFGESRLYGNLVEQDEQSDDDEERNKYKTVTKGGIFKRKDNVTTSDAMDIIDESNDKWGTVEIVKNRQKVFLIRVVKGESVVTNNEWSQVNKVLDNFIPALIKAILKINPELKTEIKDSNELKVLKTEGTSYSGEQIKIKIK